MRVLFDHGTPAPLQAFLRADHTVREAKAQGWDTLKNGDLLTAAEAAGFEVLLTTDKNIRRQQNLTGRTIAIVVLGNPQWPVLRHHVHRVIAAASSATLAATPRSTFPRSVDSIEGRWSHCGRPSIPQSSSRFRMRMTPRKSRSSHLVALTGSIS